MDHPFEVGKEYRNRRGRYVVLSIDEPKMRVRYENGHEMKLTMAIQVQILQGIELAEAEEKARGGGRKKGKPGKKAAGPSKADEREKLVVEILKTDEAIFELLARKAIPPGQINTYRYFVRNRDEFISRKELAEATRGSDEESLQGVMFALGRRIGSSADPRVQALRPRNALIFDRKSQGGAMLYRIRRRVVEIFESYAAFYGFLVNDERPWLPEEFGSEHWQDTSSVHRRQLEYFGFWERYQEDKRVRDSEN